MAQNEVTHLNAFLQQYQVPLSPFKLDDFMDQLSVYTMVFTSSLATEDARRLLKTGTSYYNCI